MKLPRIRFNPRQNDQDEWIEIADRLVDLFQRGRSLNPTNINTAIDDLDGVLTLTSHATSVSLYNADGNVIHKERKTRKKSLSAVIRELGRMTNTSILKSYSSGDTSKPYDPYTKSYGGVVINHRGLVMVVEPANHFSGVIWTFPKGGIDKGETEEICALREVKEESGWDAEIIQKIDGSWKGMTTITEYFLMQPVGIQGEWEGQGTSKEETWRVEWVEWGCARLLVSSSHQKSAKRDVEVLDKAYSLWLSLQN